ncbi:MAG: 2-polyprenylphenol 6-hydroxylase [Alphaproteobacteria bacterium]
MLRTARNLIRLAVIVGTLARHDALFPLERLGIAPGTAAWLSRRLRRDSAGRPGQRLARALQALGPSFIKLGQVLSTRSDLIGVDVARDLSDLQDRLPPFSAAEARATVERELGQPVEALFSSFDDRPVAAASIAQVHFAVTRPDCGGVGRGEAEGETVAVKILRPGIEQAFARDLDLFAWLAMGAERLFPRLRRLRPIAVVRLLDRLVAMEMDLRLEAAAASELRQNFIGDPELRVPRVDWRRTAQRTLTLERVSGIPADERESLLAAGHDLDQIMARAADVFFKQVFRDGFFHGDLHAGNLFIAADGAIAVVDFGIMGRLDIETRRYLARMLVGFLQGDYGAVADVHFEAGYVPTGQSRDAFMQACRAIGEPILDRPLAEISLARLLAQLFRVTEQFEMETQPQLLLLQKTMMVVEGVGRALNPEINVWSLARPRIEAWIHDHLGPEAVIGEAVGRLGASIERIPALLGDLETATRDLAQGGLRLHPATVEALRNGGGGRSRGLAGILIAAAIGFLLGIML